MLIRTMRPSDYDDLYRLWSETPGLSLGQIEDSASGLERYLIRNPKTSFVALKDNRIVGSVMAGHDGRRGYIYHLAVAADCRRHGIGTKITHAALSALEAEGVTRTALLVYTDNDLGNQFWGKLGFARRGDLIYRDKVLS